MYIATYYAVIKNNIVSECIKVWKQFMPFSIHRTTPANHLHIVSKNLEKGSWIPEASTERKCPQSSGSPSLSLPGAAAAVVCSAALGEKETSVCHVPVQWRG